MEIYNHMTTLRNSEMRTKSQALATFLFWLKTGLTF